MTTLQRVSVTVNGVDYVRDVEPRMSLGDFLRHELSLVGTHIGCEHGVCGACSILIDGKSVRSCLMLAVQADGLELTTIEGLRQPRSQR
jgi:carbon-monoxide dehydrogenase small subunit